MNDFPEELNGIPVKTNAAASEYMYQTAPLSASRDYTVYKDAVL